MTHLIPNLGAALSRIVLQEAQECFMHADVSAWGAPSECHELVSRGEARRRRLARRSAEAIARAPMRVILREAERRIGKRALHRAMEEAGYRYYRRTFPF